MPKTTVAPPAVPATLEEQTSDFTAEGAPPPGQVSTTAPVVDVGPGGGAVGLKKPAKPAAASSGAGGSVAPEASHAPPRRSTR